MKGISNQCCSYKRDILFFIACERKRARFHLQSSSSPHQWRGKRERQTSRINLSSFHCFYPERVQTFLSLPPAHYSSCFFLFHFTPESVATWRQERESDSGFLRDLFLRVFREGDFLKRREIMTRFSALSVVYLMQSADGRRLIASNSWFINIILP